MAKDRLLISESRGEDKGDSADETKSRELSKELVDNSCNTLSHLP